VGTSAATAFNRLLLTRPRERRENRDLPPQAALLLREIGKPIDSPVDLDLEAEAEAEEQNEEEEAVARGTLSGTLIFKGRGEDARESVIFCCVTIPCWLLVAEREGGV